MNKKIKVIDLLEMFCRKEKMPERIKVSCFEFEYDEEIDAYFNLNKNSIYQALIQDWLNNSSKLNNEVEILEDNTEEIEKLTLGEDNGYGLLAIEKSKKQIEDKINELVKEVRQQRKINDEIIMCLKRAQCFLTENGFKEVGKYIERTEYAVNKLRKEKEE